MKSWGCVGWEDQTLDVAGFTSQFYFKLTVLISSDILVWTDQQAIREPVILSYTKWGNFRWHCWSYLFVHVYILTFPVHASSNSLHLGNFVRKKDLFPVLLACWDSFQPTASLKVTAGTWSWVGGRIKYSAHNKCTFWKHCVWSITVNAIEFYLHSLRILCWFADSHVGNSWHCFFPSPPFNWTKLPLCSVDCWSFTKKPCQFPSEHCHLPDCTIISQHSPVIWPCFRAAASAEDQTYTGRFL